MDVVQMAKRLKNRVRIPQSIHVCFQEASQLESIVALGIREDRIADALENVRYTIANKGSTHPTRPDTRKPDNPSWPRPYLLPHRLCPKSIDQIWKEASLVAKGSPTDGNYEVQIRPNSRYVQNSNFGYSVAAADSEQIPVFFVLWQSPSYRFRCWVWYQWQAWLKDLWNFIKWPLAVLALLSGPAYYAFRLFEALSGSASG